jgi:transmembrane protein 18
MADIAHQAAEAADVDFFQTIIDAHNEVMTALPLNNITSFLSEAWSGPGVFDGVKAFIDAVDWTEPFFLYVLAFQVIVIVGSIVFSYGSTNRTAIAMLFLMVLVLSARPLNTLGSEYFKDLFVDDKTNYFDDNGMFIGAVFVAPLLLTTFLLQLKLFGALFTMMVRVKRAKLREEQQPKKKESKKKK